MPLQELDEKSFKEFIKAPKALVKAWREGCSNCEQLSPILEELQEEISGVKFANFQLLPVPNSDFRTTYMKFPNGTKVMLPVLFYFEDGKMVRKVDGLLDKNQVVEFILKGQIPNRPEEERKQRLIQYYAQKGEITTNIEEWNAKLNFVNNEIAKLRGIA